MDQTQRHQNFEFTLRARFFVMRAHFLRLQVHHQSHGTHGAFIGSQFADNARRSLWR